ncbi:hypothetical protein [Brachybacterium tyrofermentans]|uniref:hypothetical protein n=1 Tax=Brachybacterium tyrofermentans TaxID=47848 RepID=UPI003FD69AEB
MPTLTVRPTTTADAADPVFGNLLPDRWREGDTCRSVVATDSSGGLLGHCRGIDNSFHPDSRSLVLEVLEGEPWTEVADVLLEAQIAVSTLPLRLKPAAHEPELLDLCARHGGVLVQLMPPWRYVVGDAMRTWAAEHRTTNDGLRAGHVDDARREEMLDLYVEHYTAQHARWSPAARPTELRAENAPDFAPGGAGSFDPTRSVVLMREKQIVAQALAWPPEPDGGLEISLESTPHGGCAAREDMEACLAAVIDRSADGDVLLIDSHVTEELESSMMRDVPGPPPHPADTWTAIVGIPVPSGPAPTPLTDAQIPADAMHLVERLTGSLP